MSSTRELRQDAAAHGTLDGAIPAVDAALLSGTSAERRLAVRQIRTACLQSGFFCLDNLLGRSDAYTAVLRRMQHFFTLPDDDPRKQAINVSGEDNTHGWMPMYQEPAYQPGTLAHLESFDCGRALPVGHENAGRINRWPAIDGFRDDVLRLWAVLSDAGWSVMRGIATALELDANFFVDRCATQELSTMRLLHYPGLTAASIDDASVGIAAHTDFECITFIMQTAPGLELTDVNGHWYDTPADRGRIVVLLGDMMERWTNGFLNATGHRVRPREFERYSIVLFFAVDDDVVVRPLESFISDENPARYAPLRQREHTRAELARAESMRDEFRRRSGG